MLRGVVIGFVLAVVLLVAGGYYYFSTGMAPVATADPMMPFERKLANLALRAHIEKQQIGQPAVPADEANLVAGAKIYKDHCAACHGLPNQPATSYDSTMFPKPTQLFRGKGVTDDPPSESYWKAQNGIRLSGMPAFKTVLNDTQLWQVSQLVANADKIPDAAKKILVLDVPPAAAAAPAPPAKPGH